MIIEFSPKGEGGGCHNNTLPPPFYFFNKKRRITIIPINKTNLLKIICATTSEREIHNATMLINQLM